jgi:hypothetical protein
MNTARLSAETEKLIQRESLNPELTRALRGTLPAFKRRNLFTSAPDLPVRLRRGRPPVPAETKRANNAAHQRKFHQHRRDLLRDLPKRVD